MVTVRDSNGNTSPAQALSIAILPRVNITTTALPNAIVGAAYAATLTAAAGIAPYNNWQIVNGALPPGLTLNASTGTIGGTPTSASGGPFTFSVTVRDSAGGTSLPQSLTINIGVPGPLTVAPAALSFAYRLGEPAPAPQSISVFSGSVSSAFSVSVRSDQNFLVATPASGQTPAPITLTVNIAGLSAGTLAGQVTITGGGSTATVTVTLTVVNPGGPNSRSRLRSSVSPPRKARRRAGCNSRYSIPAAAR